MLGDMAIAFCIGGVIGLFVSFLAAFTVVAKDNKRRDAKIRDVAARLDAYEIGLSAKVDRVSLINEIQALERRGAM